MAKYWEKEKPLIVTTSKNVMQFFSEAGKLSVAKPPWRDDNDVEKQGKTVVYDLGALMESSVDTLTAARDLFGNILGQITERLDLLS